MANISENMTVINGYIDGTIAVTSIFRKTALNDFISDTIFFLIDTLERGRFIF